MVDPRAPCLVGWHQHTWAKSDDGDAPEPLDMWEQVLRGAAASTGARSDVLQAIESLRVVYTQSWQYDDPPRRLSARLGIAPNHELYSGIGGTTAQILVQDAAEAILAGDLDAAAIVSAEALDTVRKLRKRDERPEWSHPDPEPPRFPFDPVPAERTHGATGASVAFALFDNARRAHRGVGLDQYRRDLGALWHHFSVVAATNPNAWYPIERSIDEIVTPTGTNRMVGYPYTKYMIAIMDVDMAASAIVMSHERADALDVPADHRVYLRGWATAQDQKAIAARPRLWRSAALHAASAVALAHAGVGIDDIEHIDLYSCFASAPNFAADALGLDPTGDRQLTVTGGLPYFGGPGSAYMTHSIATMAETLHQDPGSYGLLSGVGMSLEKHTYAIYSTTPGAVVPPDADQVRAEVEAAGAVPVVDLHEGDATVAAYSVAHGHDGPQHGLAVVDLPDRGARAYARFTDPELMLEAEQVELIGRTVSLINDGLVNTATW